MSSLCWKGTSCWANAAERALVEGVLDSSVHQAISSRCRPLGDGTSAYTEGFRWPRGNFELRGAVVQASLAETQRLAAEGRKPEREASQVAARTGQALALIDSLLREDGAATDEPGPLSVAERLRNGLPPIGLGTKGAGAAADERRKAVQLGTEPASHNRLAT